MTPLGGLCGLYKSVFFLCASVPGVISNPAAAPPSLVGTTRVPPDSGCGQDGVRYLSVMWCKASKKKHKRWEGDAVLITRGRTATLKDMEGKDIGKGERRLMIIIHCKNMDLEYCELGYVNCLNLW